MSSRTAQTRKTAPLRIDCRPGQSGRRTLRYRLLQLAAICSLPLLAASTGCAPLSLAPADPIGQAAVAPPANAPTFVVKMQESGAEPRTKQLPLTEPLTVQQLLEKTGAINQFGRMKITVARHVAGRREPLKLDVEFRRGPRRVAEHENYTILPGDQVTILEVRKTMIEDWLDQGMEILVPLATMQQ